LEISSPKSSLDHLSTIVGSFYEAPLLASIVIGSSVSNTMTASNIAVLAQSIAAVLEARESLTSGSHFSIFVLIIADKTCFF
jgi:hypothetical protein